MSSMLTMLSLHHGKRPLSSEYLKCDKKTSKQTKQEISLVFFGNSVLCCIFECETKIKKKFSRVYVNAHKLNEGRISEY